jgi:ketosteroid isomerase-like protein
LFSTVLGQIATPYDSAQRSAQRRPARIFNMSNALNDARIATAVTYFRYVDSADPAVLDLFTDDASMFFPKFGIAQGKAAIAAFAVHFGTEVVRIAHDIDRFNIMRSGDFVIVEGTVAGELESGRTFPDGLYSFGMFCNVFEFEGALIKRVNIYEDPDFGSSDTDRVAWANGLRKTA